MHAWAGALTMELSQLGLLVRVCDTLKKHTFALARWDGTRVHAHAHV